MTVNKQATVSLVVRLPKRLHAKAVRAARAERRSLNTMLILALEAECLRIAMRKEGPR